MEGSKCTLLNFLKFTKSGEHPKGSLQIHFHLVNAGQQRYKEFNKPEQADYGQEKFKALLQFTILMSAVCKSVYSETYTINKMVREKSFGVKESLEPLAESSA
jgi:hypothetical protein